MKHLRLLLALLSLTTLSPVHAARWLNRRHPAKPAPRTVIQTAAPPPQTVVVTQDPTAAKEAAEAQRAAAASVASQQDQLNREHSIGADQRVVEHLRQRMEDGSADAPFELAQRHESGQGVTKDPAEARRLYELSAQRGNEDAKRWITRHPKNAGATATPADSKPAPADR